MFSLGRPAAPAPTAPAVEMAMPQPAADGPAKPAVKPARPVHVVTIAADPADVVRLKTLATPGFHLRFVDSADKDADFSLVTALGAQRDGMGTKLFSVPMHVVAGPAIHSMSDLRDKVVSFGPAGSPMQAVARQAFAALALQVKEAPLDLDNALDGLTTGDIDAVVLMAPPPSRKLAELRGPGLHLVAWPEGSTIPDGASLGSIPAASYPRLAAAGGALRVVAADAVLSMSAKGARQTEAKAFLASLGQHSAALSKHGFDLLKADLADHRTRRMASAEHR